MFCPSLTFLSCSQVCSARRTASSASRKATGALVATRGSCCACAYAVRASSSATGRAGIVLHPRPTRLIPTAVLTARLINTYFLSALRMVLSSLLSITCSAWPAGLPHGAGLRRCAGVLGRPDEPVTPPPWFPPVGH